MEQYIPYSLLCYLFSRNLETYYCLPHILTVTCIILQFLIKTPISDFPDMARNQIRQCLYCFSQVTGYLYDSYRIFGVQAPKSVLVFRRLQNIWLQALKSVLVSRKLQDIWCTSSEVGACFS